MHRHDKDSSWQRACDFQNWRTSNSGSCADYILHLRLSNCFEIKEIETIINHGLPVGLPFEIWKFWKKNILLQFWSKILNCVKNWWLCKIAWMTVQRVLGALLKLSWKAYYNENYPKKTIFANKMSTSDAFDQYYWRFIWFPLLGKSTNIKQLYCFSY